jgi:peptide/nickel transport system substrate-binding protein
MNEVLQRSMKAGGLDLDFEVVEWGATLLGYRSAPDAPASKGVDALNISLSYISPSSMFRYWQRSSYSPTNQNCGHWSTPHLDDLLQQAQQTFDPRRATRFWRRHTHSSSMRRHGYGSSTTSTRARCPPR